MNPKEMREKATELITAARVILELAQTEKREMTAEESAKFDELHGEADTLVDGAVLAEQSEARTERQGAAEERGLATVGVPIPPAQTALAPVDTDLSVRQDAAFLHYLKRNDPSRLIELRASTDPQTIGTAGDGGYAVPDEWYPQFVEFRAAQNVMRGLATIITSKHGTLNIIKEGVEGAASWVAEEGEIVVAKETIGRIQFTAYKAARLIKITTELLWDEQFGFREYLLRKIAKSIGTLEETGFVAGSGSSQPNGIFTAATTGVTVAGQTSITADELMDLEHSVTRQYRRDAVFMMADGTLKIIRKLKDGSGNYLLEKDFKIGVGYRLLGYPVTTTEDAPAATTGLDSILFGDPKGYYIVDRKGLEVQTLVELFAVNGFVGYIATARTDGDLVDTNAVRVMTMAA